MRAFNFLRDPAANWWDRARHVDLPRRLTAPVISGVAALGLIAAWTAIDAAALRSAIALQSRAQMRVDRLQGEIDRLEISRAQLQATAARLQRLREIRGSGVRAADRIARLDNAVADGTWLASISAEASSAILVKGYAANVDRLAQFVANVVGDPAVGRLTKLRFSTDARTFGRLTFDLQVEE